MLWSDSSLILYSDALSQEICSITVHVCRKLFTSQRIAIICKLINTFYRELPLASVWIAMLVYSFQGSWLQYNDCYQHGAVKHFQILGSKREASLEVAVIPFSQMWRDETGLSCSHCLVSQNYMDVSKTKWLECRKQLELNVCCFQAVPCLGQHPGSFCIILLLFWNLFAVG